MALTFSATLTGGATIPVTSQTSVTYDGETFNFNQAMPVGFFVTGKPFVLSTSAFQITSTSTPSSDATGSWAHGMMKDPLCSNETQSFDELLQSNVVSSTGIAYYHTLNVDPGATGSAISVAQGEEASFVKAIRRVDTVDWQQIEKYVPLTVLSAAPPVGAYMPAPSALTKTIKTRSDVSASAYRALTFPASFDTFTEAASGIPSDIGHFGANGQRQRRFRLDNALGTTTSGYSAQIADGYARYLMLLHSDTVSAANKQAIIDFAIESGMQLSALIDRGARPSPASVTEGGTSNGAGQQGGTHPWIYYAAFLLQDSAILTNAKEMASNMSSNGYWATSNAVGIAPQTSAGGGVTKFGQPFFTEHIGTPFILPDEWTSAFNSRYGALAGYISVWETLAVAMLQNGPGSVSGTTAMLDGGAYDETNSRAAHIAWMDRVRVIKPWPQGDDPGDDWRDMYDLVQPLMGVTAWTGRPEQPPVEVSDSQSIDNVFSAGPSDGAVSWTVAGHNTYSTEDIARHDFRYSLDGVQWVTKSTVPTASDSATEGITLLKGVPHYLGLRKVSTISGAGLWSSNYISDSASSPRGVVTTPGTEASAAPSNTVQPTISAKIHPSWNNIYGNYKAVTGTFGTDEVELAVGLGYWTGSIDPATHFSFQWQESADGSTGWTDITIANGYDQDSTSQFFTRRAENAGQYLRCNVTCNNGVGSVTVASTSAQCPALATVPATTLIDTEFGWAFRVDYETQLTEVTSSGGTFEHDPIFSEQSAAEDATFSIGAVLVNKDGTYPNFSLPFKNPTVAGRTYDVTAQITSGATRGPCLFDIIDALGNSVLTTGGHQIDDAPDDTPARLLNITDTITGVSAGETLRVKVNVSTATGGGAGGDPVLTKISVVEQ